MPWLWMNFFDSILKCDQLTQTGWFGKESSWFLRSSLSIHELISGGEGVLKWCLPVGFLRIMAMYSLKDPSGEAE